jgi:hypothetical protein
MACLGTVYLLPRATVNFCSSEQFSSGPSHEGSCERLLHEHVAHDDLVAWGWQPGEGRDPVPGSQALLGDLIQAWIDTGAQCP